MYLTHNVDTSFLIIQISEIEDGKKSVRSLKGYRRDSEVMYSGTVENTKRGRLNGVFNGNGSVTDEVDTLEEDVPPAPGPLTRSISQPDFVHELTNDENREPASIFVRPGIGSLAFRY